ncbi:hypothetical protein VTJ49DRAFT_6892 [Mycothermus thermophilus]|uniref:Cep57 centrosome microtubule-binding domain-containing protein n=1 Tax=Humicola insolens TaxID=85995 RepID=A0ABR3VIM9_HUMIN
MDINSNSRSSHAAAKPRHISRLRKEMLQHRMHQNPFSSPPSSTGSHDTVSTTTEELTQDLSDFTFSPDGEGTRRFSQSTSKRLAARSSRFASRQLDMLNTSVIARTFPEWSGLLPKDSAPTQTSDMAALPKPVSGSPAGKENMPPNQERASDTLEDVAELKRRRFRTDLHARVENESDCSTVLSLSPPRPSSRRSRFSGIHQDSPLSPDPAKPSLQEMMSKIRTEKQALKLDTTPKRSPAPQQDHQTPPRTVGYDDNLTTPTRSFFLPSFRHLPEWTSGALKFSTMKNGVPVFVRTANGVRLGQYGQNHEELRSIGMSKEDEEMFVSLDKLQEEVRELHDHDAMLQREAERLQHEVNQLQAELKRLKSRNLSDSALGSESDASFRRSGAYRDDLEYEVAQLRERLGQVGGNDIHSAALAAERDEALHQASLARERATKLQAELEATQKDLESSLHLLQEKEELQLEHEALLAENQTLKEERDSALKNNKTLASENDKLRRELSGVQMDLRTTREELASARRQYEALQAEKRQLAQDHNSMERNNDSYFRENKKLQAQVAARDQHIADLKKGISSRDRLLDNMQGLTTDTAILELNAELQAENEQLHEKVEQQAVELSQKDGELRAKDGRMRSLKEQNLDLAIDNEQLREENQRLRAENNSLKGKSESEAKAVRQTQAPKKTVEENKANDNIHVDDDLKQREEALRKKLERRALAVQKVKRLSHKIIEIAEQEFTSKSGKVTRIIEPTKNGQTTTTMDEMTGKGSAVNLTDDDPTRELHLDDDSEFDSVMEGEIVKLRETYQELQKRVQQDLDMTDYSLPSLPPALHRSKSDSRIPSKTAPKTQQLPGILKKSSQFEDTGRFSVKSGLSIASHQTEEDEAAHTATHTRRSSLGNTQELPRRPVSRQRRHSVDATEPNMTSAFFVPDITLEGNKQKDVKAQNAPAIPSLSKDARRVLDGICKHNSVNCNVCVRIATHGGDKNASAAANPAVSASSTTPAPVSVSTAPLAANKTIFITPEDVRRGKKTVQAVKPVPVSDRPVPSSGVEDPTIRPAMAPGEALAVLIKETQDEIDHLQMELRGLNEVYFNLDKAIGMRERRRAMAEIKRVQGELEARSAHLYRLHDVLEGQKQAGQLMEGDGVDVTVLSGLLRAELLSEGGEGEVWEGFE